MRRKFWALGLALLACSGSAAALENIVAKITVVEATYMPNEVVFQLDSGSATCPVGNWVRWQKDTDNNKAIYATLLAAMTAGKRVNFYYEDATCKGVFLHVLAQ